MRRLIFWVPLAALGLLIGMLAHRLTQPGTTTVASHLIGKPMPKFALPAIAPGVPGLTSAQLADGHPKLINIFASWCIPCAAESQQLAALRRSGVIIDGIVLRDTPEAVTQFLAAHGNPYAAIGSDVGSDVAIALGSTGVPETYVVDGHGIIRAQHIGELHDEDLPQLRADLKAAQ